MLMVTMLLVVIIVLMRTRRIMLLTFMTLVFSDTGRYLAMVMSRAMVAVLLTLMITQVRRPPEFGWRRTCVIIQANSLHDE